jgi:hypothetical protein
MDTWYTNGHDRRGSQVFSDHTGSKSGHRDTSLPLPPPPPLIDIYLFYIIIHIESEVEVIVDVCARIKVMETVIETTEEDEFEGTMSEAELDEKHRELNVTKNMVHV